MSPNSLLERKVFMKTLTVLQILENQEVPVVAIDEQGIFTYVNDVFEKTYGWKKADLIGNIITVIMPEHMRDAHNFGFSRFLTTETARILGKPLALPVRLKDGTICDAEHYILGEKDTKGSWRFAATITPLTPAS